MTDHARQEFIPCFVGAMGLGLKPTELSCFAPRERVALYALRGPGGWHHREHQVFFVTGPPTHATALRVGTAYGSVIRAVQYGVGLYPILLLWGVGSRRAE